MNKIIMFIIGIVASALFGFIMAIIQIFGLADAIVRR